MGMITLLIIISFLYTFAISKMLSCIELSSFPFLYHDEDMIMNMWYTYKVKSNVRLFLLPKQRCERVRKMFHAWWGLSEIMHLEFT